MEGSRIRHSKGAIRPVFIHLPSAIGRLHGLFFRLFGFGLLSISFSSSPCLDFASVSSSLHIPFLSCLHRFLACSHRTLRHLLFHFLFILKRLRLLPPTADRSIVSRLLFFRIRPRRRQLRRASGAHRSMGILIACPPAPALPAGCACFNIYYHFVCVYACGDRRPGAVWNLCVGLVVWR